MSRKTKSEPRIICGDPIFGSVLLEKMINKVMRNGKKSLARSIVYGVLKDIRTKHGLPTDADLLSFIETAVEHASPLISLKSRRIGGATYQVPMPLTQHKSTSLGLKWIVEFANDKKGVSIRKSLAVELCDAYNETGLAYKKKQNVHKMAEANKAFAGKSHEQNPYPN